MKKTASHAEEYSNAIDAIVELLESDRGRGPIASLGERVYGTDGEPIEATGVTLRIHGRLFAVTHGPDLGKQTIAALRISAKHLRDAAAAIERRLRR